VLKHAPNIQRLARGVEPRIGAKAREQGQLFRLTDAQRFDWLRLIRCENVGPRTFRALIITQGRRAALDALPELARKGGARRDIRIASVEDIERDWRWRETRRPLRRARRAGISAGPARQREAPPPILAFRAARSAATASHRRRRLAQRLRRGSRLRRPDRARAGQAGYSSSRPGARHRLARHVAALETGTMACSPAAMRALSPEAIPLAPRIAEHGAWCRKCRSNGSRAAAISPPQPHRLRLALGVVVSRRARLRLAHHGEIRAGAEREVFAVPGSPLDPRAEGATTCCARARGFARASTTSSPSSIPFARRPFAMFREDSADGSEPLWGTALLGVDPEAAPRARPARRSTRRRAAASRRARRAPSPRSNACSAIADSLDDLAEVSGLR